MQTSIWVTPESLWPKASREFIFLADAFRIVGQKMHGKQWTGEECRERKWPRRDNQRALERILAAQSLGKPQSRVLPLVKNATFQANQGEDRLQVTRQHIETEKANNELLDQRRDSVAAWIADCCRNSEIATFGIKQSWSPYALPSEVWNVRSDWSVFEECELKYWVPQIKSVVTFSIFLDRKGFDRNLGRLAPRNVLSRASAEKMAEAWLRESFTDRSTIGRSRSQFKDKAMGQFNGLTGEGFNRAWGAAAADFPERSKPGAKAK